MDLYILGRQPGLGLAELERLTDAEHIEKFGNFGAIVRGDHQPPFACLGGSVKRVGIIREVPYKSSGKLITHLLKNADELYSLEASGRHTIGLSLYGIDMPIRKLNALSLSLKKHLRTDERSIRVVEHKQNEQLESAQVLHNGLLGETGRELVVAIDGERALIGLTSVEQNIESYTLRDRGRPMRDAQIGMLPPKLAQILINLAAGQLLPKETQDVTLLDPFCGTGVVPQEALLMGYRAYGSDLDERMVKYTKNNLQWLKTAIPSAATDWHVEQANAAEHSWSPPLDAIACETYLGPPLSSLPSEDKLQAIVEDCNQLHKTFLKNLATQLKSGTPVCLAVPAWRVGGSFLHLPMIDSLVDLGYNRVDFKHVRPQDLLYWREDQLVARELLVLTRK